LHTQTCAFHSRPFAVKPCLSWSVCEPHLQLAVRSHMRTPVSFGTRRSRTWQADAAPKTIKLFSDAGFKTPFGSEKTFSQKVLFVPIDFRLDWIWLRGLEVQSHGIDREVVMSDHWPLWTNVKLGDGKK